VSEPPSTPNVVLFVCVANAGRSLMAESIFNAHPPRGWTAGSAGTAPAVVPNPRTEGMLGEIGLRLPPHPPRPLTMEAARSARRVVTMGCLTDASCPAHLKEIPTEDWGLDDPVLLDDDGFRRIRDEIARRVAVLVAELERSGPAGPA